MIKMLMKVIRKIVTQGVTKVDFNLSFIIKKTYELKVSMEYRMM
jgi:hypothetical protein